MDFNSNYSFDQNTLEHPSTDIYDFRQLDWTSGLTPDELAGLEQSSIAPAPPLQNDVAASTNYSFVQLNHEQALANIDISGAVDWTPDAVFGGPAGLVQPSNTLVRPVQNDMDFNTNYSFSQNALEQPFTDIFNFGDTDWSYHRAPEDFSASWQLAQPQTGIAEAPFELDQSSERTRLQHYSTPSTLANHDACVMSQLRSVHDPNIRCDWPACQSIEIFPNQADKSYHVIQIHVPEILDQWPGKCQWPGCSCKSNFPTRRPLEIHIENIHTNPLCCDVSGCKRLTPFSKQGQLDRHKASVHKIGRSYKCTQLNCRRHADGFGRRDKLIEHMRSNRHGPHHCPHDHCEYHQDQGFISNEALNEHLSSRHGQYECGIANCVGSLSHFIKSELLWHVRMSHVFKPIPWDLEEFSKLSLDKGTTIILIDLELPEGTLPSDCKKCKQKHQAAGAHATERPTNQTASSSSQGAST